MPQRCEPYDLHHPYRTHGIRYLLQLELGHLMDDGVKHYTYCNAALSRNPVRKLIQLFVEVLQQTAPDDVEVGDNGPCDGYVTNMVRRHGLAYKTVHVIEGPRFKALSEHTFAENIARAPDTMDVFYIRGHCFIFKLH